MKYEGAKDFDYERTLELLNSDNEADIINALLSIVLNGSDYDLSIKKSIEFAEYESEWVKGCAIECLGHIARIHNKIDLNSVKDIISNGLKSTSKIIIGKTESAVDDITHFMQLKREVFL